MEPRPYVFLDTETTGLDPYRHEIWELAAVRREPGGDVYELEMLLRVTLAKAAPRALEIGGFKSRYEPTEAVPPDEAALTFSEFARDAVLLGLNISFDMAFLGSLFHRAEVEPTWHYSPVDVKSLAAGVLAMPPPWGSEQLAQALGIDPSGFARHSALADCHYTAAIYDLAMERVAVSAR